jgi:hypothetical protein
VLVGRFQERFRGRDPRRSECIEQFSFWRPERGCGGAQPQRVSIFDRRRNSTARRHLSLLRLVLAHRRQHTAALRKMRTAGFVGSTVFSRLKIPSRPRATLVTLLHSLPMKIIHSLPHPVLRCAWSAAVVLSLLTTGLGESRGAEPKQLRVGMVGLDTSHVPAFTKFFNNPKATGDVALVRVVAGYPGGTDILDSRTRVEKFTEQVREMGVEIVATIPQLLEKVDVVLLESVDGRIHLQEAIPIIKAGKPLFIDKPVAGSLSDAIVIYELAKKHSVPCFSSSSLRFNTGIQELSKNSALGGILGAHTWYTCSYQQGTPDMFFYGIHGIEPLFVLMGRGCESVSRVQTKDVDLVTGVWKNGRVGTYRGIRGGRADFGAIAFGKDAIVPAGKDSAGYAPLCEEIAHFFKTGKPPVSADETLEIFTFMEAADESKRQGGASVSLASVWTKAKADAATKLAQIAP